MVVFEFHFKDVWRERHVNKPLIQNMVGFISYLVIKYPGVLKVMSSVYSRKLQSLETRCGC